ncbi:hypothetical protein JNO48_07340 [Clostridiales bacterium]|nr:hypothetical protein JNO48_07340 [Clostridiales bacterium]
MDQNEHQESRLAIDKDAQINVVVNAPESEEDVINLSNVFHNAKLKSRVFAWVLVLCMVVGIVAPLLLYQINPPMLTATSVVTLKYDVAREQVLNGRKIITYSPAKDLTAPDGSSELDLSQITSAYVLQQALEGMDLSQPITLAMLRKNISIERVLTDESRRAQELASQMVEDKNTGAYAQMQNVRMIYNNKFVVRLTNGFTPVGAQDDAKKLVLKDAEVKLLLDRILSAYNDYLVLTYANVKLPDDELFVIDTENLDLLESLELLQTASDNLYNYCDQKSNAVKAYRSHKDGRNLEDWMKTIETGREIAIDYLYSYVYNNSIVRDKNSMITNYRYQLRNAQSQLDVVNSNVATIQSILENYKNDEIFVSMQESDTAKSTRTTTDYYNELILQQANNYASAAKLETTIADLNDKIANLTADSNKVIAAETDLAIAEESLQQTIASCRAVYEGIKAHMEELISSPFYTTYAEHTEPQDRLQNFISANLKKMIIGAVAGAVIACGIWFLAALAPEFQKGRKDEDERKEAAAV